MARRVLAWHYKFLSFGGKLVSVNHVLQSLLVYLQSAMNPPKGVIESLHMIFAKFF